MTIIFVEPPGFMKPDSLLSLKALSLPSSLIVSTTNSALTYEKFLSSSVFKSLLPTVNYSKSNFSYVTLTNGNFPIPEILSTF